jgi:hypothetical protein
MVTPYAFAAIQAMGNNPGPLPESRPDGSPIVLRASLLDQIRTAVQDYNGIISAEAGANRATLVDIYSLVNDLAANGTKIGSQQFATDFGGGLFSLDGVHPTDTGYAVIANEFIKTMNRSLNAKISPVSLEQVTKTDPLITSDKQTGKKAHVSVSMAAALAAAMR